MHWHLAIDLHSYTMDMLFLKRFMNVIDYLKRNIQIFFCTIDYQHAVSSSSYSSAELHRPLA